MSGNESSGLSHGGMGRIADSEPQRHACLSGYLLGWACRLLHFPPRGGGNSPAHPHLSPMQGNKALALPHLSVTDISSIDWEALRAAGLKVRSSDWGRKADSLGPQGEAD